MKNPYSPRFKMDHKLPLGSFWRRMTWHGQSVDVYFFSEGHGDSYMCRYSDEPDDYASGYAGHFPFTLGFSNNTPLEDRIEQYEEIIYMTQAYLEWKGIRKCPHQEIRDEFKKETDAKHLELSPGS